MPTSSNTRRVSGWTSVGSRPAGKALDQLVALGKSS